jgi:predicted PurR-regulated permease PerM
VGAYIRSEVLQTVLAGVLLAGGYWLIGIKYPFLLALFAALAWLVPLLGGVFALAPLIMIGWLSGPLAVLFGLIYTVAILVFMEFLVQRRLYRHERYGGVLVVVVMMALGDALGLLGLLMAPPIAVALQSWLNEISDAPAAVGVDLPALQARLADIHARVHDGQSAVSPRQASLAARLDALMAEMKEEGNGN